ncbi:putative kinase inhibitor protein [Halalkalicoccus paucihalophilus]|uniref:Putative kinase inhibitor protein n=1 Tax=Halalkalicoccus paucihalophilus TaxID=1008153 RepID=A0A151ADI5_9EURY|nr:YbhB/YbcL family Raf kinase inhibitor-like protein [Halalkalicoccus paucihalophilus]KYH25736.1 putative kinase inhibitor protein [Halalkalicoccus paucihalophilus]
MAEFTLTSPEFRDDDPIPRKYGYEERNVNPPLRVENVPEEAESLALIVDDPDAEEPAGKVWDHWLVWNVDPGIGRIPEAWEPDALEGRNDFGEAGYGGPNPPDGEHTYEFTIYALDAELELPSSATKEDLIETMAGHVLAQSQLTGTYAP